MPTVAPVIVRPFASTTFAIPKSVTIVCPSLSTMMLAGLMSRWMMPRRWAYPSASPTWCRIARTSGTGNGPTSLITESNDRPSMNFITKNSRWALCFTA